MSPSWVFDSVCITNVAGADIFQGIYSASKRSLELLSECLRLEMEPFGVNVIEVVTAAVTSKGLSYFEDLKLPVDSIFRPIEATIIKRAQGKDGYPRMDTDEYATSVVDDILAGATGRIWKGAGAERTQKSSGIGVVPQSLIVSHTIREVSRNHKLIYI